VLSSIVSRSGWGKEKLTFSPWAVRNSLPEGYAGDVSSMRISAAPPARAVKVKTPSVPIPPALFVELEPWLLTTPLPWISGSGRTSFRNVENVPARWEVKESLDGSKARESCQSAKGLA
jgi:hypothetical protein